MAVYPQTNEVFVADGYGNRRVIVFDADTGMYRRHWGAYSHKPDDAAPKTPLYQGPGDAQFNQGWNRRHSRHKPRHLRAGRRFGFSQAPSTHFMASLVSGD